MSKHMVKCPKCGLMFDTNSVQAVKVSARRYGHATCYPDNTDYVPLVKTKEQDTDYIALMNYIKKIFGDKANYAQINRQLKIYTTENGYSYSGIMKSLIFFFEVKGNSIDKANGAIGIVPYVYQDAYNYYLGLYLAQQANQNKTLLTTLKEIIIRPPKMRGTKQKFFNLGEWENNEE